MISSDAVPEGLTGIRGLDTVLNNQTSDVTSLIRQAQRRWLHVLRLEERMVQGRTATTGEQKARMLHRVLRAVQAFHANVYTRMMGPYAMQGRVALGRAYRSFLRALRGRYRTGTTLGVYVDGQRLTDRLNQLMDEADEMISESTRSIRREARWFRRRSRPTA